MCVYMCVYMCVCTNDVFPLKQLSFCPFPPPPPSGRLIPGSPAARCGQLYEGDILLGVNYQDVTNIEHSDVVALIKNSALTIRLLVEHPGDMDAGQQEGMREVGGWVG